MGNYLIILNAGTTKNDLFCYQNIFWLMGLVCFVTIFLLKAYTRDVILDDAFTKRRERSGSVDNKKRVGLIVK